MRRCSAAITAACLVAAALVVPSGTLASASAVARCAPKQLSVTQRGWAYNPSTAGSVFQSLLIYITNEGATCVIGGLAKITPTGVKATRKPNGEAVHVIVEGAAISSTKYAMLTLAHSAAAFAYLNLVHPMGDTSTVKKWTGTCRPATATGFTISIVPARELMNRQVKAVIPDVCTSGQANDLSSGPLAAPPA
jgi:hypothetical protein